MLVRIDFATVHYYIVNKKTENQVKNKSTDAGYRTVRRAPIPGGVDVIWVRHLEVCKQVVHLYDPHNKKERRKERTKTHT